MLIWVKALFFASNNHADAPLCKSQDSLIKFIYSIDEGFELLELIFDKQGNVVDFVFLEVNPAYEKQTGLKAANIVGKRKKENAPAREQRWYDYAIKAVKTGKTLQYDYYNDNVNRYFDTQFIPISTNRIAVLFKDITERKKAEEALKESEERFRSLFSSMAEAFALHEMLFDSRGVSVDYRFLEVNEAFEKQTGLRASEILGKTVCEVLPDLEPFWIETYGKVVITGEPVRFENYNRSLRRYYEVYAYRPVQGRFAVIFTDITERKESEEKLRSGEKALEEAQAVAHLGSWKWDLKNKRPEWSAEMYRIYGVDPDSFEITPENALKLTYAEDREFVKRKQEQVLEKGIPASFDHRIVLPNGELRWVHVETKASSTTQENQSLIFGTVQDITERKKAEEALKESEEKFQNMIEQSPATFGVYDENGLLIQVNSAWDRLWQVPREHVIGKWNILQSKQIEEIGWLSHLRRTCAGETVLVDETEFDPSLEPEALGKGRKRWVKSVIYPIKNVHGEVTSIVMMHEDVTEKKDLKKQLKDKERLAAIGQTAGMVGHDLRNPLQSIIGEVYLAKSELDSLPDGENKRCLQESIQAIGDQVGYMDKIVSDLQTFVKPVEAKMEIINLKPVVTALLAQTDFPKNIQAGMQVDDKLIVNADAQLLNRVLINLVTNAVQAMADGGELTVKAQSGSQGKAQITVEDTGTGIPEEVKPKIFTPLFTTKSKGQGFGLAVCKRVIEAQNGTITFESQVGKGTKFIIEMPAQG